MTPAERAELEACRASLREATDKLKEQDDYIKSLMSAPLMRGKVTAGPAPFDEQNERWLVELDNGNTVALLGHKKLTLAIGQEVLTLPTGIVSVVPAGLKVERKRERFRTTSWNEVGGLREAKRLVREALDVMLMARSALGAAYGIKPSKGVLLSGPPGNGKTLLARAAATHVAAAAGAAAEASGFILVSGPELLHWYVGRSEFMIRELFKQAREHHDSAGYPALLVIDEADALLPKRGAGRSSDVERTIVPTFLAEMDGFEEGSPLVMLMTNLPQVLDPAVVREGRVDLRVHVGPPSREDAQEILGVHLSAAKIQGEAAELSNLVLDCVYGNALLTQRVSGAMLATMAQSAIRRAFVRDTEAGRKKPSGVCREDLVGAFEEIRRGHALQAQGV